MGRVEQGSPWGVSGKESACQSRRPRFDPWVGKIPWRRKRQPTPYTCLGNPTDRGARPATVHEIAESDTTEHTHTHDHKQASHRKIMSATKSWPLWSSLREEINALGRLIFNKRRVLHQGRADRICFPVTSPFNGSRTWWTWENTATSYMDDIHSLTSHLSRAAYLKVEKDLEGNWIITDKALNG